MSYALTSKGQVTIPKGVRESLGVGPGERIEFRINDRGEVVIERADGKPRAESRFATVRGIWAGRGFTTDEIMAMTRGEPE
ncbi:MAG TPA: type II toxin-antitoxin system PrlF family antitoxin [Caulobacter sp.]|nr:type II toxin-antitoxin system PrlF family antitoxin [Caulobacter sp.]